MHQQHVNNNSLRGRLIIEAFEKRAPDSGLQTFLKCKKKEKPLENHLFAKEKCRQLEKKLRKLFMYSPVFNLLWLDPTIIAFTIVKNSQNSQKREFLSSSSPFWQGFEPRAIFYSLKSGIGNKMSCGTMPSKTFPTFSWHYSLQKRKNEAFPPHTL